MADKRLRKPDWLRVRIPAEIRGEEDRVAGTLSRFHLNTVCHEALCPNRGECFQRQTATFMILGAVCSRNCAFCNVNPGKPGPLDPQEPENVARAAAELNLRHVVVTSVTRDDLSDGGSAHFALTVDAIRKHLPRATIEVLIPDFKGSSDDLDRVIAAAPDIINHNIETVPRLYRHVRPQAVYERSLELLKRVKERAPGILTKSGMMLGLGEEQQEVLASLSDLRKNRCDMLTLGQYLAPSADHYPVKEYVTPDAFDEYGIRAREMGFSYVASAPLVRSSYLAEEALADRSRG
ncbi:MAG: lipoyl synthase [Spirochaetales bacterium]|nr:lipoyl synthase [Spirochaetales bacterium]